MLIAQLSKRLKQFNERHEAALNEGTNPAQQTTTSKLPSSSAATTNTQQPTKKAFTLATSKPKESANAQIPEDNLEEQLEGMEVEQQPVNSLDGDEAEEEMKLSLPKIEDPFTQVLVQNAYNRIALQNQPKGRQRYVIVPKKRFRKEEEYKVQLAETISKNVEKAKHRFNRYLQSITPPSIQLAQLPTKTEDKEQDGETEASDKKAIVDFDVEIGTDEILDVNEQHEEEDEDDDTGLVEDKEEEIVLEDDDDQDKPQRQFQYELQRKSQLADTMEVEGEESGEYNGHQEDENGEEFHQPLKPQSKEEATEKIDKLVRLMSEKMKRRNYRSTVDMMEHFVEAFVFAEVTPQRKQELQIEISDILSQILSTVKKITDKQGRKKEFAKKNRYDQQETEEEEPESSKLVRTVLNVIKALKKKSHLNIQLQIVHYNLLIAICFNIEKVRLAIQLFQKLEKPRQKLDPTGTAYPTPNEITYASMIKGFLNREIVSEALRYYEMMKAKAGENLLKLNIVSFASLISGLVENYDIDSARKVFDEMGNFNVEPDIGIYTAVMNGYVKIDRLDQALELLLLMEKQRKKKLESDKSIQTYLQPDVKFFGPLIHGYAMMGDAPGAKRLLEKMEGIYKVIPDEYILEQLFRAFVQAEDEQHNFDEDAKEAYNRLLQIRRKNRNYDQSQEMSYENYKRKIRVDLQEQQAKMFITKKAQQKQQASKREKKLIKQVIQFLQQNKTNKALNTLKQMVQQGYTPDVHFFTKIFIQMKEKESFDKMKKLVKYMKREGLQIILKHYNMLMDLAFKQNKIRDSIYFLNELVRDGLLPDKYTFTALIDGFSKHFLFKRALSTFKQMRAFRIEPDVQVFTSLIYGYSRNAMPKDAYNMLKSMKSKGVSPNVHTYTSMIEGFSSHGDMVNALQTLHMMRLEGFVPDEYTYHSIISGYGIAGDTEKMADAFLTMEREKVPISSITYNILLHSYLRNNQLEEGLKLFEDMKQNLVHADVKTYTILVDYYCKKGMMEEAMKTLDKMVQVEGIKPNLKTFTTLMLGYALLMDVGKMEALMDRMKEEKVKVDLGIKNIFERTKELTEVTPKKQFSKK